MRFWFLALFAVVLASCKTPPVPDGPPAPPVDAPLAVAIPHLPGFVYSPHTNPPQMVAVAGEAPGAILMCPYTQRPFRLPGGPVDRPPPSPVPPAPAPPPVVRNEPPSPPPPPPAPTPPKPSGGYLYGTAVPGRPGFCISPWAGKDQVVDVSGMAEGSLVKCPFTGKIFRVPAPVVGN